MEKPVKPTFMKSQDKNKVAVAISFIAIFVLIYFPFGFISGLSVEELKNPPMIFTIVPLIISIIIEYFILK